jgi:hypothetical protein
VPLVAGLVLGGIAVSSHFGFFFQSPAAQMGLAALLPAPPATSTTGGGAAPSLISWLWVGAGFNLADPTITVGAVAVWCFV